MIIEKKIWIEYFQKIIDGNKKYELRLADFECNEGDILLLKEWDNEKKEYTGRKLEKKVKCVVKTKEATKFWTKAEIDKYGFQIISFD
ncbi:DUF3850 domain-containing protein [archaeon]|nr:DUF3850 domain-containing protein [archaeon]